MFASRLLILSLLLFTMSSCNRQSEFGLNPGDFAPDFELPKLDGTPLKLSSLRGKVVFLNFWASWCGPCQAEMPGLQRTYEQLKSSGFEIVAVGTDDTEENIRQFAKQFALSFPVVLDPAGEVRRRYRTNGFPESFIIDRQGKLVLFKDLDDNMPVVRIIGPRDWESNDAVGRLKQLLAIQ